MAYGSGIQIYPSAELRIYPNSSICLGNKVAINVRTLIAAVNGGVIDLKDGVSINSDSKIVCHDHITIGENTIFGPNVLVYDHDHKFDSIRGIDRRHYNTKKIVIGRNCWIGSGTIILKGSVIGDNCVIGAGSILKGTYSDHSIIIQKRTTTIIGMDDQ